MNLSIDAPTMRILRPYAPIAQCPYDRVPLPYALTMLTPCPHSPYARAGRMRIRVAREAAQAAARAHLHQPHQAWSPVLPPGAVEPTIDVHISPRKGPVVV